MARPFSARSIFIASLVLVVLFLWALTVYSQGDLQVGYAVMEADPDSALPVADFDNVKVTRQEWH